MDNSTALSKDSNDGMGSPGWDGLVVCWVINRGKTRQLKENALTRKTSVRTYPMYQATPSGLPPATFWWVTIGTDACRFPTSLIPTGRRAMGCNYQPSDGRNIAVRYCQVHPCKPIRPARSSPKALALNAYRAWLLFREPRIMYSIVARWYPRVRVTEGLVLPFKSS